VTPTPNLAGRECELEIALQKTCASINSARVSASFIGSVWPICPAIQLHTGPLDMGEQSGVMNRGQPGKIDHSRQQQVIEIGLDAGQGGGADGGADQGEIDIGGRPMTWAEASGGLAVTTPLGLKP
jgi:hypothetical protein